MSVRYPNPAPVRLDRLPHAPVPFIDKTLFLPAAPPADVELVSLIMAPMMPPMGPRL